MIPAAFRKSATHRKLYATMQFLVEHEPYGPIAKQGSVDRNLQKAALDRHRTILEAKAHDTLKDYFDEERAHVVNAVRMGKDAGSAIESLHRDLGDTYRAAWKDAAMTWADWVQQRTTVARKAGGSIEARIDDWLKKNAGKRITGITESQRKRITAEIAKGEKAGLGVQQIARNLDKFYLEDIIPNRALVIAQTEIGSATNWAQYNVAQEAAAMDVPMEKEWLSLRDDRVRDDHRSANGQRQPMDEPFLVGDDELMYPSDPSGSPEEVINCRCSVLYHVVEEAPKKIAKTLSPAEFAKDILGIENPDVATSLAFMKGVFTEKDEWTRARTILMKHVHRLRRAKP